MYSHSDSTKVTKTITTIVSSPSYHSTSLTNLLSDLLNRKHKEAKNELFPSSLHIFLTLAAIIHWLQLDFFTPEEKQNMVLRSICHAQHVPQPTKSTGYSHRSCQEPTPNVQLLTLALLMRSYVSVPGILRKRRKPSNNENLEHTNSMACKQQD